jgi:Ni/Co efflux regulator RcnB
MALNGLSHSLETAMTIHFRLSRHLAVLAIATAFSVPAFAGHGGKGDKDEQKAEKHADKAERKAEKHAEKRQREEIKAGAYFNDHHREVARAYYAEHYGRAGKCPPGLAKKDNGCMPPGQAKRWAVGQPLPRDVVVYSVPQPVLVQLPPVPYGYRYGRVGGDIVLMARQNNVVVDIVVGF